MSFWEYETISLKLYIEVSTTGNYRKLIKRGWATTKSCAEQFEKILSLNSVHSGSFEYINRIYDLQGYNQTLNEYNFVKAALTKLLFKVDKELIQELAVLGYTIALDGGQSEYVKSINQAFFASENLVTQLHLRANDMQDEEEQEPVTMNQVLANMSYQLGFKIDDGITLDEYNAYKKIVIRKSRPKEEVYG